MIILSSTFVLLEQNVRDMLFFPIMKVNIESVNLLKNGGRAGLE